MGIEARCPNGHVVRVKDRFAGKKAHCPDCGATFRVPAPAVSPTAAAKPDATALPLAAIVSLDGMYAASLPRATAIEPDPVATRSERAAPPRERRQSRAASPEPQAEPRRADVPAEPAAPRQLHAVIAEAPDAMWNVALPGGDPSEPLSGDMLQEWLDDGGATGVELVWREDWPDWVPIRLVFPEHLPPSSG